MLNTSCRDRPELLALLKRAREAYDAMPLEQRREHWRAQKRSWVRGELMMTYPEMTVDEANALIDRCEIL